MNHTHEHDEHLKHWQKGQWEMKQGQARKAKIDWLAPKQMRGHGSKWEVGWVHKSKQTAVSQAIASEARGSLATWHPPLRHVETLQWSSLML